MEKKKRIRKPKPKREERLLTPQQELFLSYWTNPDSDTFSNALQSALKAGYTQEYAESITYKMPEWLAENVGTLTMVQKAERNLIQVQNIDITDSLGEIDPALVNARAKVDFFILEKLNKKKYGSKEDANSTAKILIGVLSDEEKDALLNLIK